MKEQWYIFVDRATQLALRIFTDNTNNTRPTKEDEYYLHSHCGTFNRLH